MTKLWSVFLPGLLLGSAGLLLAPAAASSQEPEPLVTDRPDFTESASVPGGGRIQGEGGWTVEEDGTLTEPRLPENRLRHIELTTSGFVARNEPVFSRTFVPLSR